MIAKHICPTMIILHSLPPCRKLTKLGPSCAQGKFYSFVQSTSTVQETRRDEKTR